MIFGKVDSPHSNKSHDESLPQGLGTTPSTKTMFKIA